MPGESQQDTGEEQAESPIDELIREILNEAGVSAETPARGKASAALLETAFASALAGPKTSMIERYLLAEAFGSALADALAPAVAELLAPRLMKYLEQVMSSESESAGKGQGQAKPARSGGTSQGRKPGS
jgi:hypothetical protein